MKLLTDELKQILPEAWDIISRAEFEDDTCDEPVHAHFFTVTGVHWYVVSGKPLDDGDWILFVWAQDPEGNWERGSVALSELEAIKIFRHLGVERDRFWETCPISKIVQ